jgi:16S rRNA processing protein RimM
LRSFAELVAIGRVIKPQGRYGEVLAESLSDRPDRFPALSTVYLRGPQGMAEEYRVLGCRPHKGRFALKLMGVDSIDAAERLRGSELGIVEGELRALPPGSYYYHELVGLSALDDAGRPLGVVGDILETGAVPVLQIVAGTRERLIPLAQPFIGAIDLRGRTLRVHDAPEDAAV